MFKKGLSVKLGAGALIIGAAMTLASCSNKITEEQLAQLRDLRQQERSLTESIQNKQKEKADLDRELQSVNKDLKDCNKNMDFVKQKLSQWPNVWPELAPPK